VSYAYGAQQVDSVLVELLNKWSTVPLTIDYSRNIRIVQRQLFFKETIQVSPVHTSIVFLPCTSAVKQLIIFKKVAIWRTQVQH
jgi:hypothetical protein